MVCDGEGHEDEGEKRGYGSLSVVEILWQQSLGLKHEPAGQVPLDSIVSIELFVCVCSFALDPGRAAD
jgi:hypothetical protein